MAKPIRSEKLFAALQEAGAIPKDGPPVRRMVLDMTAGQAAVMYVEFFADEEWLTVTPLIAGVQVVTRKDVPVG